MDVFKAIAVAALTMIAMYSIASDDVDKYANIMMILSDARFSDQESTEKRYKFILPRFIKSSDDVSGAQKAADMMYASFKQLDDAGLGKEEGLLTLSNNLYSMTSQISTSARLADLPLRCAEIWSMYLMLRLEGTGPAESSRQIIGLTRSIYGLVTE